MRRGALPRLWVHLKDEIAKAIEGQGVSAGLARRFAAQIARKSGSGEWGDRAVWIAIGVTLRQEVARLRDRTGLSDRQIETVLPKLSARQVEQFIEEYCRVAGQLQTIEPKVARTVANAAFTARAPREKAIDLFSRFSEIVESYKDVRRARPLSLHSGGVRVPRKRPA
jgi:hypothetical protein